MTAGHRTKRESDPLHLVLGLHHQMPLGSSETATEHEYQEHHRPYLSLLNSFPEVRVALHYSGPLLEWLDAQHPEYIMLLRELVERHQVELVGGAYYDAALSIIPNADRLGQVEKLTTHLRSQFGIRPRGSALAEGVWEPSLASTLHSSGMEYVFLSAAQLQGAADDGELHKPLITEDQGRVLSVLPVTTAVLGAADVSSPTQVCAELRALARRHVGGIAVAFEAGLPSSRLSSTERTAWLSELFQRVLEAEWVQIALPQQALAASPERPRVYLGCSTRSAGVGDGALFRRNLVRYPESRMLYARMMYTHLLVNQIRGDKARKRSAQNELWRGQSHTAYWNGSGGGIRSPHVRHDAYRSFIEAEKTAREHGTLVPGLVSADFDLDGLPECLFHGKVFNAYVHHLGGALVELDHIASSRNYQASLVSGDDPAPYMPPASFRDRFSQRIDLDVVSDGAIAETGDFLDGVYRVSDVDRDRLRCVFERHGVVAADGVEQSVAVRKRYQFRGRSLAVDYHISNLSDRSLRTRHAVEMNLAFSDVDRLTISAHLRTDGEPGVPVSARQPRRVARGDGVRFHDAADGVLLTLISEGASELLTAPVVTPEGYQATTVAACWDLDIPPGGTWENVVGLAFARLR